jgi:hypothetical protein
VNAHLSVFWVLFAAAATVVITLVVHEALQAFSQASDFLAGT